MGAGEYYMAHGGPLGDGPQHLEEAFDPTGVADDPDKFAEMKLRGFTSGRLAISSFLGYAVQAVLLTGILLTTGQSMM